MTRRFALSLAAVLMAGLAVPSAQHGSLAVPPAPAGEVIKQAVARAATESKIVWVDFGASWCGWCRKLEAFLTAPEVKDVIAKHYIIVNLTVQESADKKALENPGGGEVMQELGGRGAGLPFYAYLDASGNRIANSMAMPDGGNIGFPANAVELKAFVDLLDRTAPRMSAEERGRVVAYLDTIVPKK